MSGEQTNLNLNDIDLISTDSNGDTLLHRAIKQGDIDIVQYCINSQASLIAKNHHGQSPLDLLVQKRQLLKSEINSDVGNKYSLFFYIAFNLFTFGEINKLNQFIYNLKGAADELEILKKDLEQYCKEFKIASVIHGILDDAKRDKNFSLVATQIDWIYKHNLEEIDIRDQNGYTPLHIAIKFNQLDIIQILMIYKASLETPLDIISHDGSILHHAVIDSSWKLIGLLIGKGADLDQVNDYGDTPLTVADADNNTLLEKIDSYGNNVFHLFIFYNYFDALKIIFENAKKQNISFDLDKKNNFGYTPLQLAQRLKYHNFIQLLTDQKDTNSLSSSDNTPSLVDIARNALHQAVLDGNKFALDALLKNGADPNQKDKLGYTPLHYAAFLNDKASVGILIKYGADHNQKDNKGKKPLNIAIDLGYNDLIKLFSIRTIKHAYLARKERKKAVKQSYTLGQAFLSKKEPSVDEIKEYFLGPQYKSKEGEDELASLYYDYSDDKSLFFKIVNDKSFKGNLNFSFNDPTRRCFDSVLALSTLESLSKNKKLLEYLDSITSRMVNFTLDEYKQVYASAASHDELTERKEIIKIIESGDEFKSDMYRSYISFRNASRGVDQKFKEINGIANPDIHHLLKKCIVFITCSMGCFAFKKEEVDANVTNKHTKGRYYIGQDEYPLSDKFGNFKYDDFLPYFLYNSFYLTRAMVRAADFSRPVYAYHNGNKFIMPEYANTQLTQGGISSLILATLGLVMKFPLIIEKLDEFDLEQITLIQALTSTFIFALGGHNFLELSTALNLSWTEQVINTDYNDGLRLSFYNNMRQFMKSFDDAHLEKAFNTAQRYEVERREFINSEDAKLEPQI
ncbi:ankyrin repeat domain-containing protein [Thiotrichales bacterium 19S11-10]|nr:ankyrin repeat domain-containing protein [Thiotrichales bacterium 19S11-10]